MRLFLLILAPALLTSGCICDAHESAVCGVLPADTITSFVVTTRTGADTTDADIYFCVDADSWSAPNCANMDTPIDNFERNQVDEFTLPISVPAGEFRRFWIENRGHAIFGNNEWEIAGLSVEAQVAGGTSMVIYEEPTMSCENELDSGSQFHPISCAW